MTSSVSGGWKINWTEVAGWAIPIFCSAFMISYIVIGGSEGNGMVILGFVSLVVGIWVCAKSKWDKKDGWFLRYAWPAALFLFFLTAPFLHIANRSKIWIVDGKTTLNNIVLFRVPFTPLATSIKKNQDIQVSFKARTKKDVLVKGTVSGEFRLTDDGNELVSRVGTMENPDKEISAALSEVVGEAFRGAMAQRDVAYGGFDLDVDVGTASVVRQLGLRRNGSITVSGLKPQFIDY